MIVDDGSTRTSLGAMRTLNIYSSEISGRGSDFAVVSFLVFSLSDLWHSFEVVQLAIRDNNNKTSPGKVVTD